MVGDELTGINATGYVRVVNDPPRKRRGLVHVFTLVQGRWQEQAYLYPMLKQKQVSSSILTPCMYYDIPTTREPGSGPFSRPCSTPYVHRFQLIIRTCCYLWIDGLLRTCFRLRRVDHISAIHIGYTLMITAMD